MWHWNMRDLYRGWDFGHWFCSFLLGLCLGSSGCLVCHLFCSLVFSFWVKLLLLVVFFRVEFGVDSFWMLVFFFGLVVFVLFSWQLLLFLPFLVWCLKLVCVVFVWGFSGLRRFPLKFQFFFLIFNFFFFIYEISLRVFGAFTAVSRLFFGPLFCLVSFQVLVIFLFLFILRELCFPFLQEFVSLNFFLSFHISSKSFSFV